jgi:ABC-type nitrate/sulfonate/bicarbonate transport system permease component
MFAAVMFLAVTGVTLTLLMNFSERRVLWWHESVRTAGGR